MRLSRKRVILIAGALVLIWLVIVLLTPPPSASQPNRRRYDDEASEDIVPKHLRTFYNAIKVSGAAGREQDLKDVIKEFADFEDFQPDGGAQGNNGSVKLNAEAEKLPVKEGDTHGHNASVKLKFRAKNQSNSNIVSEESALLEIEKDLIPRKISLMKSNPSVLWNIAASWVKSLEIYPQKAPQLGDVLHALSTIPILKADVGYKGTQLKAKFLLEGGQVVVFKPKRFPRNHVIYGKPYAGYDRHNGEIAAFHLDRVLDLRRAPLVAGRTVNLRTEIKPVATRLLLDTYITQDNNTCFYGKCYYCNSEEPACADGDIMEGSVTLWLPKDRPLKKWRHLWSRTYKDGKKARWEFDNTYCQDILAKYPLDSSSLILDMIDAAVFDYLIGNADRHQYETFEDDGDQGMLLLLDNAKSFGNPHHDERSILAPLYQCCRLRRTLWVKLQSLQNGTLSKVMRQVMSHDPVSPVLSEKHLTAMDRRLGHIIAMVGKCFNEHGETHVLQ